MPLSGRFYAAGEHVVKVDANRVAPQFQNLNCSDAPGTLGWTVTERHPFPRDSTANCSGGPPACRGAGHHARRKKWLATVAENPTTGRNMHALLSGRQDAALYVRRDD